MRLDLNYDAIVERATILFLDMAITVDFFVWFFCWEGRTGAWTGEWMGGWMDGRAADLSLQP